MTGWRPDRSHVLLALASGMTGWWLVLEILGNHPDYGLLGVAAPLWAAWATLDRDARRYAARQRRRETLEGGDETGPADDPPPRRDPPCTS